jgi:hypothetical protein
LSSRARHCWKAALRVVTRRDSTPRRLMGIDHLASRRPLGPWGQSLLGGSAGPLGPWGQSALGGGAGPLGPWGQSALGGAAGPLGP